MSTGKWKPKRWPAPRSRRTRDARSLLEYGFTQADVVARILKNTWRDGLRIPPWAEEARARGWMSLGKWCSIEWEPDPGPKLSDFLYEDTAFYQLISNEKIFDEVFR